jgi:hypothetical protein
MMADFYGTDHIHFEIVSDEFNTITVDQNGHVRPLIPRYYDSFSQAAGENAQSRIYLGIHWHFDAVEGIRCGDDIADYIFNHDLRPVHGGGDTAIPTLDPETQIHLAIIEEDDAAGLHLAATHFATAISAVLSSAVAPAGAPQDQSDVPHKLLAWADHALDELARFLPPKDAEAVEHLHHILHDHDSRASDLFFAAWSLIGSLGEMP